MLRVWLHYFLQGWRRLNKLPSGSNPFSFFFSQFQIWITARSPRYGFILHFFSPNAVNILLVITAIIYPWYCAHQFSIHHIIGANLVYLPVINYSYFFQLYQDLLSSSTAVCLIYQIEETKYLNVCNHGFWFIDGTGGEVGVKVFALCEISIFLWLDWNYFYRML